MNLKNQFKYVLICAFICQIFPAAGCISHLFDESKPYENDKFGFSLRYPKLWLVNDTEFMDTAVVLVSPSPKEGFKPNINVFVRDPEGLNLSEYVSKSKTGLDSDIPQIGYKLKKFISEGKSLLGKYKGSQLSYIFSKEGIDLQARSIYYLDGEKVYILTATAKSGDFEKYEKDFSTIVNSFRIN